MQINPDLLPYDFGLYSELPLTWTLKVTAGSGTLDTNNVRVRKNSTNTIGQVYGTITIRGLNSSVSNTCILTSSDTGLRPNEDMTLSPCGFVKFIDGNGNVYDIGGISMTLQTDGKLTFTRTINTSSDTLILLFPSMFFVD